MTPIRFRPPAAAVRGALSEWLDDFIKRPHPELGRPGPVCPFVEPAQQAGAVELVTCHWSGPRDLARMSALLDDAIRRFKTIPWRSDNTALRALVVAITGLEPSDWWLIDKGHHAAKDALAQGLMLGLFHPNCLEPAAHNSGFRVNRAPLPVVVIRNMAFHDILFLHENPTGFDHYRKRFGHSFAVPSRIEPHFAELFTRATQRQAAASATSPAPTSRPSLRRTGPAEEPGDRTGA